MNRWITTREGFDAAEARYREPKDSGLVAQSVQHFYLTDPAVHAETLPPPLLPGDRPEVWVSIGWMESLSLGVAQVALRCQVDLGGDVGVEDGWYCLHLPMTTEAAVVGGRERYGENKKIADIAFERTDGHVTRQRHPLRRHLPRGAGRCRRDAPGARVGNGPALLLQVLARRRRTGHRERLRLRTDPRALGAHALSEDFSSDSTASSCSGTRRPIPWPTFRSWRTSGPTTRSARTSSPPPVPTCRSIPSRFCPS